MASSLGAKISIEKVSVTFINRVHLTNLYIEDQRGDTLLQAGKITAILRNINREDRLITIKKLTFYDAYVNFITDSSDIINLKFIIDFIKKPDREIAAERIWKIRVADIEMENSRFCYSKDIIKPLPTGINFTAMDLGALNINLSDFNIQGDSISMKINELNFVEKSGFLVNSFKSKLIITKKLMHFDEVDIKTPFSEIRCDLTHLNFTDFTDFSDFVNLVNIELIFQPSQISFSDIAYFAPELTGYQEEFNIAGLLSGNVNDIKGDKIILSYNIHTRMETSFNIIGLPDFKNTFMHFDINNLITSTTDIELLKLPGKRKPIELPDNFMKLGKIIYSGKYTGYPDDFVAYGRLQSNLGDVHSDLLIKPDTANTLRFVGRLKTIDFKIGELIDAREKIGKISMIGNVEGSIASGSLNAQIESTIDSFEVFGYNYENIIVSGTLTERNFSGSFAVTDPNINLEFIGKADFSGENPEFAFTADVARARPYYLNIGKSDPSYFASFLLKTNFTGNKLDDLNGEISLVNSLFSNADQQIQMYDFSLKAFNNQNNSDSIIIRSDLIDGEIYGSYKFSTLIQSFNKLANYYIPSFGQNLKPLNLSEEENDFSYNIRLKDIQPFILFFFHDFDLSNNTNFYGQFNPSLHQLTISAECPFFSFKENTLEDITVLAAGNNKEYEFAVSGSRLSFKNNLEIKNVNINAAVSSDTANIMFVWDNLEAPRYNGNIDVMTVFDKNDISGNTRMNIFSRPSSFHYNNVLWNILESEIAIETKFYKIDTLRIRNQDQDFYVYGTISEDPTDVLYIKFSDLDISALNVFTKKVKIEMEGFLSGEASISDPINKPLFLSDLTIEEFKFNQEFLGKGFIHGFWNNDENKVELTAETQQGDNKQIQIKGDFYPENDVIDFNILIDKLSMTMFEPFLAEVISDLRGLGSGNLSLKGTMNAPDLNGNIRLQKTSLMVNYLFTRYYFTNDVSIVHNNVIFRDFEIFDEKGNKGISQGSIITNNLKSINLDLRLSANNFTFLNTTEKDNDLFYGRVNASGLIRFTGPLDDMYMDINAKTERNSVFFIPLFGVE